MKPAPFDFIRPGSSDELAAVLAEYGGAAAILAGGQSLMPQLNLRLRRPRVLIDLAGCADLGRITLREGQLIVGAAVTQSRLEHDPRVLGAVALLGQALPHIGNPQVRNRGTFCGSLAHAHPAAELPLCMLLLDGSVELRSLRGTRQLSADAFFRGAFTTACQPDEFVAAAMLPRDSCEAGYAFDEVSLRSSGGAIIACAAMATPHRLRLGIAGAAPRASLHELPGIPADALADAVADLAHRIEPISDMVASASYRRQLIRHVGYQVLLRARRALAGALAAPGVRA